MYFAGREREPGDRLAQGACHRAAADPQVCVRQALNLAAAPSPRAPRGVSSAHMADLVVPQLGESISEAVVAKWLKQVGDAVADGEPVAELETDKITVELPSPVAGALSEQRAAVGATVKVGDVIGAVDAGKAGKAAAK